MEIDELLTVIVQTSPIPSHPSTALLEALFRSFDKVDGLKDCRIYILCDACEVAENEQKNVASNKTDEEVRSNYKHGKVSNNASERYRKHLESLEALVIAKEEPFCPHNNGSIELVKLSKRHGSARGIEAAFLDHELVPTPFVMIAQHDNFFVQNVPLRKILSSMQGHPWLKCLHFLSVATVNYIQKTKKRYGLDLKAKHIEGFPHWPLIPLAFWYGRTQVARTEYYTDFVLKYKSIQIGDHLEELLGMGQLNDMLQRGPSVAHELYGNYVLDQGKEVLYHLSGRRARAAATAEKTANTVSQSLASSSSGTTHSKAVTDIVSDTVTDTVSSHSSKPLPRANASSFTTARSYRAIVPGLEIINDDDGEERNTKKTPRGKFKQKCFHCGVKGHSYKFCPNLVQKESSFPRTEIINL